MATHKNSGNPARTVGLLVLGITVLVVGVAVLSGPAPAVLNPAGLIASEQKQLLVTALIIMLVVIGPVFFLIFYISHKYRATNDQARYQPDWDSHRGLEAIWWGFPLLIVAGLSVIIWQSSHNLDPSRALASSAKPLTVQVVALQWKWLFLYPEQNIASLNYLALPTNRPISFQLTADAPMNSFWIPQLGGQIYAMPGMTTKLQLQADKAGNYHGGSANISGSGFARMQFTASARPQADFDTWVQQQKTAEALDITAYNALSQPAILEEPTTFAAFQPGLFQTILNRAEL